MHLSEKNPVQPQAQGRSTKNPKQGTVIPISPINGRAGQDQSHSDSRNVAFRRKLRKEHVSPGGWMKHKEETRRGFPPTVSCVGGGKRAARRMDEARWREAGRSQKKKLHRHGVASRSKRRWPSLARGDKKGTTVQG